LVSKTPFKVALYVREISLTQHTHRQQLQATQDKSLPPLQIARCEFDRAETRGRSSPRGDAPAIESHRARQRRVVDYIATRSDLDSSRLLYCGLSMGLSMAPCTLAVEPRFKAAALLAGGFYVSSVPETAPQNYLPRVKLPVLLVTGRYDFGSPYETSQKPFFDLLGTPAQNKRHVVLDAGHLPPQYTEIVKEMLAWADSRLGPVAK